MRQSVLVVKLKIKEKMRSDSKKNLAKRSKDREASSGARKSLEDRFKDGETRDTPVGNIGGYTSSCEGNVLGRMNLGSRKALRSGAEKIGKTFRRVKSTIGAFTQHFHLGSHRRQRLTDTPCHTPASPQTRSRQVLGRTPTKLYSPFGIETPRYVSDQHDSRLFPDTPEHEISPARKRGRSNPWSLISRRPRSLFR